MTETLLKELITPNIKEVISTKIDFFIKNINLKYKEMLIPRGEHFEEYLLRAYEKYRNINTLVFHNSQRLLKDIYVPQTLVKENQFNNIEIKKITKFPSKLIEKYRKLLITDTAGMGKSTIMKRMFIDVVDNCMKEIGIPIYIELNRLGKNYGILEEIKELLKSLSNDFNNDLLLRLIQSGGFIFFLDGYDEISISDKENVTNNIQDFISKAGINNYYIMTSRPDASLTSFGDFQSFKIAPLERNEAFELLKKYDLSDEKKLSSKLIELLNTGQYKTIDEYLQNPLLVSLLFTAYDYNRSIPFEKHRFYNVVFEAYFEKHDSSKPIKNRDKYSGLNYDSFDRVLRFVGFRCLLEIGVNFNKDTILNTIRQAKEFCGNIEFDESDFLKDLIKTVPLFCQEGTDYKWVHKSLLEYFAARFIFCDAKDKQDNILSAIYKSDNINKYIRYPFCREYISYYESIPSKELSISTELIEERKSNLFVNKYFAVKKQYSQEFILKFKEKNKGFEARETIFFKSGKCVIKFSSTLSVIEKLLYNHSKELFSSNIYSHNRYISSFPFVENIENSCFDEIDIKKCNEDDMIYENLNLIMNLPRVRQPRYYLNYNACKKVVEDFEQKLKDESAKSELLKGL